MIIGGRTTRRKKRRQKDDEDKAPSPPPDVIADPLQQRETDPLRVTELRDDLAEEAQALRAKETERREAQAEEEEEKLDIIEELLEEAPGLDDEELTPEVLEEGELELEEIPQLMALDDLGTLMNELAATDALDLDDPVVEAIVEDDLMDAVDASTTGFANAFVTPQDMIANELQSQQRPYDDADTRMQVTPMSWVPNRVKIPLGRRAMDEPMVDRAINHEVKQDVSTQDEDNDIGVRTRRRYTPQLPSADAARAGLSGSHQRIATADIVEQIQSYHEVMQQNPDFAKTFVLGQIRMLERWVFYEEPRLDLAEGQTPLDWVQGTLLPKIQADMMVLQSYFDYDHDMIFYRQWKSELVRVVRKAHDKIKEQDRLRREQDEQLEREDRLAAIPEGELLDWSMANPEDALELYEDPELRDAYAERLLDELFEDGAVQGYLDQVDRLAQALDPAVMPDEGDEQQVESDIDEGPDPALLAIQDALLGMDLDRLEGLSRQPEMSDFADLTEASVLAVDALSPVMRGLIMTMMTRYGAKSSALAELARDNPGAAVMTVTHGAEERPINEALVIPPEAAIPDAALRRRPTLSAAVEEEEDDDGDAPGDDTPGDDAEGDEDKPGS